MAPSLKWFCWFVAFSCFYSLLLAAPTTDIDVIIDDPQQAGCKYDEKFYNEGQTVETKEPCLNCTCQKGALRCHLQVCPYLHDLYPPPAGCVLVERKSACCPKLHCPTEVPGNGRLQRKDPSGQIAAWRMRDDLRKRLVKQLTKNGTDKLGCVEGGTLYAEGSAMMTSSTCQYCFCLKGKQTCVKPQCAKPVLDGCTPQFRDLACCPTHYDCAISKDNVTSIVTKQKKPAGGDAGLRPMAGGSATTSVGAAGVRENDRIIDLPRTTTITPQQKMAARKPLKHLRTKRDTTQEKKAPLKVNEPPQEEETSTTLVPGSLIDDPQPSMTETISPAPVAPIETITSVTPSSIEKAATSGHIKGEPEANDVPQEQEHPASLTIAEKIPVPPASAPLDASNDLQSKAEDENLTVVPPLEGDVENSWVGVENPLELIPEANQSDVKEQQADDPQLLENGKPVTQELETEAERREDIEDVEAEAAERAIEVSVSSSTSSVSTSQSSGPVEKPSNKMNPPPPPPPAAVGNFVPIDNKAVASFTPITAPVNEELDYDYDNMELPPSLPNLEIIPFVASDAVVGLPSNLDDDERLNLGGVAEQRVPLSQIAPSADQPTKSGSLMDRADLEEDTALGTVKNSTDPTKNKVDQESVSSSTTPSPMLAFKVTFPPRPSSTLPPSTASPIASTSPTNRFTLRRTTTTQRTSIAPFRSKLTNKPAVNNLVGVSAPPTGGLRIDSCNIYGQMYRVGRIIDELSGPCVECKCTEIGVNCINLKC